MLAADETSTVTEALLHHRHKVSSSYLGRELAGVVTHTFLAGEEVFRHPAFLHRNRGQLADALSAHVCGLTASNCLRGAKLSSFARERQRATVVRRCPRACRLLAALARTAESFALLFPPPRPLSPDYAARTAHILRRIRRSWPPSAKTPRARP
ncbi:MAG: hypothetical protein WKG07_09500 [Hymenobacter sp.]